MLKIILDTDIGDDIDDALALSLVINSPELCLLGVTTVFRNTDRRAKLAEKLFDTYGIKNVPVYAGIDRPFIQEIIKHEKDMFDKKGRYIPCQYSSEMDSMNYDFKTNAVDFIISTVCSMPGEVTIVPIGPLTNIAAAIRICPEICSKIRGITLMGGIYTEQFPEWNIYCDPEAAKIVFSSGIPIHMVGLDVTLKCKMGLEEVERIKNINTSITSFLSVLIEKWLDFYKFECPVLHDPLAVATLIDESIVKFEKRYVDIGLYGEQRGCTFTMNDALQKKETKWSEINVGVEVDRDKFMKLFLSRLTRKF